MLYRTDASMMRMTTWIQRLFSRFVYRHGIASFAMLAVLAAGCQQQREGMSQDRSIAYERPEVISSRFVTVGQSVEGRPIACQILGDGPDTVLLMASIHGDEPAGTPLLARLAEYLTEHPATLSGRTVVLLPVANPDGFRQRMRENVHGVDLNRNFPANNFSASDVHGNVALSEPESVAIGSVLDRFHPARIVSIHQPYGCIDYDGPAEGLAQAMGEWTDIPVKRVGSRPGSLGSYAGVDRGIPIITLELPEGADDLPENELWDHYGKSLLAAIRYPDEPI